MEFHLGQIRFIGFADSFLANYPTYFQEIRFLTIHFVSKAVTSDLPQMDFHLRPPCKIRNFSDRSISFTLFITPTILLLTLFHCRVLYKSFKDDEAPSNSSHVESLEPCLTSNLRILANFTSLALFLTLSLIAYMSTLLYSQPHLEFTALLFLYSYLLLQSPLMGRIVFKMIFESAYMSRQY